ncbi:MAG TPA: hypothetical protein VHD55_00440 [Candidatus Paceibacterota bacterium]|nr:hypothetical protein [Candidatus Paceibacterota bacterium]
MDTTTQAYLEILEKTNQQLSLWYNPYGLMVAVLTGLVAALAIVFAFILWRQQKEYKDAFKDFLAERKKFANSEIAKAIVEAGKVLDDKIIEADKQLKDIKDSSSKTKKDIEKEIQELKKSRESLQSGSAIFRSGGVSGPIYGTAASSILGVASGANSTTVWDPTSSVFSAVGKICGFCGTQNYPGAQFCFSCGNPLG